MNTFENSGWQPKWMNEWCFFFWKKFFLKTAKNENENYIFMFCIQPSSSSSSNWIERYRTWMFSYWPNKTFFHYVHTPFDCVGVGVCGGDENLWVFFFCSFVGCWSWNNNNNNRKKMLGTHTHTGDIEVCRWLMHSFFSTIIKWWIELRSFRFFVRFWHCKTDQIDCVQANWKQK